jgi:hypothetical protein
MPPPHHRRHHAERRLSARPPAPTRPGTRVGTSSSSPPGSAPAKLQEHRTDRDRHIVTLLQCVAPYDFVAVQSDERQRKPNAEFCPGAVLFGAVPPISHPWPLLTKKSVSN